MSRSPILARLLWKDAWVLWPLTLTLSGLALFLYLLVPLLPGNQSATYSAWLLLFPNLFALGASQLQVGQEEESRTFYWTRALPIPWRSAFISNVLTATIGLATVWMVCGIATYIAYLNGGFRPASSFATGGTWSAELYRVITFSWMLLSLGYLCSWYFRSPIVTLIAVVPTAFLSVGLTHLVNGWIEEFLLSNASGSEPRPEIYLIGHTNLLLTMLYGVIAAYLARRRWTQPESERGFSVGRSDSTAYRPAPPLTTASPAPSVALLWQSARQSSVAILAVIGVLLLSLIATVLARQSSFSNDSRTLFFGTGLISVAIIGALAFGGDHARDRHRFLAEIGLSRWQVWWTRLLVPLLIGVLTIVALGAFFVSSPHDWPPNEIHTIAMIGMAVFGISQLTGMWIRRPAVAIGSAVMLFVISTFLSTIYNFYEDYLWTAWIAIGTLFLASLSMCRRWMDRDRGPAYHAGMVGWLGVASVAVILPIIGVRWWTTPAAMPEWREQTLAMAASIGDAEPIHPVISHVDVRYRPDLPYLVLRADLKRLQNAFADAADADSSFPMGYDLAPNIASFLHIARSSQVSEAGRVDSASDRYRFEMRTMGGVEKWYADLLSFALDSVDRLPEHGYVLRYADQADQYEEIVVKELELPVSRNLLGEDRWRELVGRLRTAEQREEDRREALLASYRQLFRHPEVSVGEYWPWSYRAQSIPWERARARRWMDAATRVSLEQLSEGVPKQGSAAERKRLKAWQEALDMADDAPRHLLPTLRWNSELDRRVEALRAQAN